MLVCWLVDTRGSTLTTRRRQINNLHSALMTGDIVTVYFNKFIDRFEVKNLVDSVSDLVVETFGRG